MFKVEKSDAIFDGRIIRVRVEHGRYPDGRAARFEIVYHPGAAAVVPLHGDGSVTLVHQYRHTARGFLYELPAGLLEEGESPVECAQRELAEEVGLSTGHLEPLSSYRTTPGFSDEVVHLFLGRHLVPCDQALDPDEILNVVRMPLERAIELVRNHEIEDGKTIIGLLTVHMMKLEGRL